MRFRRREKLTTRIPSNSLADIAFLLLTFFLVTTTIERDRGITMTLPAKGAVKQVAAENIVRVELDPSGTVYFNEAPIALNQLAEMARGLNEKNPDAIFSVQPSKSVPYKYYIGVLDQLREAQVRRIAISESGRF
ncbi:biopolymer transporter ExbD [candidate division KSB1 bacterium]|nr:biopolymer transporter ExbD [candidate division KSB1 bacterium]